MGTLCPQLASPHTGGRLHEVDGKKARATAQLLTGKAREQALAAILPIH